MYKSFKQALRALSSNKARTILTTLGIMIGIATVILVLSAGAGFRRLIDDQVASYGTNTLYVQTKIPSNSKNVAANHQNSANSGVTITSFNKRDLDSIK